MPNISFIGLGKMGSAIVERMLTQGLDITVYNRSPAKIEPLVAKGAKGAQNLAEAVANADLVFSSLLDDKALIEVSGEMLSYLPKAVVHISTSTIMPKTAEQVGKAHEAHGSIYISATVLGIPRVALAGELTTYCSGNQAAIEKYKPILNKFSKSVINLGESYKAANVMKVCMNYSLMTTLELISELYVFAEKNALDISYVQEALHQIYGHPSFKLYVDKIKARNFDEVNFDMIGGNKDVSIFQNVFNDTGVAPEIGNIVKSRFVSALAQGMEKKDWSAIYEIVRKQAGL